MRAVALWPAQVTTTVPKPARVFDPMTQDHETIPTALADFGVKPCALLTVPAGVV